MYKKVFQNLTDDIRKKEDFLNDLHKNIGEGSNSVLDRKPHFIFSADRPLAQQKLGMSTDQVFEMLENKGYNVEKITGRYGQPESSIVIHDPPKHSIRHLHRMVRDLGQESSIYSDGYNHELHYHNGDSAGMHAKGQGTEFFKKPPEDFYSRMNDETIFRHHFDLDNLQDSSKSSLKQTPMPVNKSESNGKYKFHLAKAEKKHHPLETGDPNTKLVHYSPQQGLKTLDPQHHGVRKIGAEAKQGRPDHPMAFFYIEGTEPESIVTTGSKSKYIASLGDRKFYDVGKDPDSLWQKAKDMANKRQINQGIVQRSDYHQAIKDSGYHGIYNSSLNDTMRNVVGSFHPVDIEAEHPMHPEDYKMATSKNIHERSEDRKQAREYAKETGHHSPDFLTGIKKIK